MQRKVHACRWGRLAARGLDGRHRRPYVARVVRSESEFDVAVIGAGFGGLAAALSLAERGARVVVFERLRYPGGCASTFRRGGYAFEAGATLFSGLAPDQLFGRWIAEHRLEVPVDWIDPLVELRTGALELAVPRHREALVERFRALAGPRAAEIDAFFATQRRVADVLWALFDDPTLLPPFDARSLLRHAARSPRYLELLPWLGRPLGEVVRRHGLEGFAPLRDYLDAVCQITVQTSAATCEAPFGLAAMDYFFRGTGHVVGGIGVLASALVDAIRALGGEVRFSTDVRGAVASAGGGWALTTRRGPVHARRVAANLLPHAVRSLLGKAQGDDPTLDDLAARVEGGWGAAMLYAVVEPPSGAGPSAHHLELVADREAPFVEGNHVFVSISGEADVGRAPPGQRTITASTHVDLTRLRRMTAEAQAAHVASVQEAMQATIRARAPAWWERVTHLETASPRTFERFTGRFGGYVGGIPRRAGLDAYRGLGPTRVAPGMYLVGDSVFPGQSTLGVALGGVRVAARLARELGLDARRAPLAAPDVSV